MNTQVAAFLVLILGLIGVWFMARVLMIQIPRLNTKDNTTDQAIRYVLFYLALSLLFVNLIPVAINIATVFVHIPRSASTLNPTGLAYLFSNAVANDLSAGLLWLVYRIIENNAKLVARNKVLQAENNQLNDKKEK